MSQWESADGWEDASWEDAPAEAPFSKQVKSVAKKSFAGVGNTVDRAWSGLALALADAFGQEKDATDIHKKLQERVASRDAFAQEDEVKAGLPASLLGMLPSLPSQMLSFPLSPFETGQRSLEMGEDLGTAQRNQVIRGAGNAAALALPASVGFNKAGQAVSGAGINALQDYVTGHLLADSSSTPEAKKEFTPTPEQMMQSALLGGFMGVAAGPKRPPASKAPIEAKLEALDNTTPKPVAPEPAPTKPIPNVNQMELPDAAMIQAPQYGVHDGLGRFDENGIPIRADLSMEAQNMQNPLQMNLWGDELGPAQGFERSLTDSIDQMRETGRTAQGKFLGKDTLASELGWETAPTPELNAAKLDADTALSPREGPFRLPENQRGVINMDVFDPAFRKVKAITNGVRLLMVGREKGPIVAAFDSEGKQIGELRLTHDNFLDFRPPEKTDNLEATWVTTDPNKLTKNPDADRLSPTVKSEYPGLATEMYKFAAEQGNDIVRSFAQTSEGRAMWDRFEKKGISSGGKISRQRGAINAQAITESVTNAIDKTVEKIKPPATAEDAIGKLPGMGKTGKDLIYVPEPGVLLADKARAESDGPALYQSLQAGLDHASEKTGSTLMKGAAQWLQYARRMADFGIRENVIPLEKTFGKLDTKEMVDLMAVNRHEMFNRKQYTPEQLASVGLNPKQIEAYNQYRAVQAKVLEIQNKGRAALGKEPITEQNAYLASVFHGDYHIAVKDGEGKLAWYIQQPSIREAKAALEWLKKNGEGLDTTDLKIEYKPRPFADVPRDVMGVYQDALKMFPEDDPVAQKIRSIMEEYATEKGNRYLSQQLHHVKKKQNVRGFMGDNPWLDDKTNAYNQAKAQIQYMKDAYRWTHMQEALTQLKPMLSDPEIVKNQPNNMGLTKSYVLNNMGVSKNLMKGLENYVASKVGRSSSIVPGAIRDLKGIAYMLQLGGSVGYMIATPFQLIPGLAAWHSDLGFSAKNFYRDLPLTLSDGLIGVYHDVGKDATGGKWDSTAFMSDFGKEAYRWAEANGVFSANLFDENAGLGAHKVLAEGSNILGYTISKPDQMSRWMSFLSFARHLEGDPKFKGDKDAMFQRAAELTEHVATDMHRQSRPLIVDQFGSLGEAAYMYRAPQVNMLNTLSIFARKAMAGNPVPFLTYMTAMAMMGGVLNLPGVAEVDKTWELIKEGIAQWKPEWYKHVEDTSIKEFVLSNLSDADAFHQTLAWGAASVATGANMASRFSQEVVDLKDPLSGFSPLGQEIKEQMATARMLMNPNQDTFAQAVREQLPPLGQGLLESYHPSFKSGVNDPNGQWTGYRNPRNVDDPSTMVKRSPEEEDYKKLGLTALTEAQRRTKDYVANQESARVKKAQESSMNNLFNAIRRDDQDDIEKYAKTYFELHGDVDQFINTLNVKVQRLGMTSSEFQKAHINGLTKLMNVARRVNMDKGNQ